MRSQKAIWLAVWINIFLWILTDTSAAVYPTSYLMTVYVTYLLIRKPRSIWVHVQRFLHNFYECVISEKPHISSKYLRKSWNYFRPPGHIETFHIYYWGYIWECDFMMVIYLRIPTKQIKKKAFSFGESNWHYNRFDDLIDYHVMSKN